MMADGRGEDQDDEIIICGADHESCWWFHTYLTHTAGSSDPLEWEVTRPNIDLDDQADKLDNDIERMSIRLSEPLEDEDPYLRRESWSSFKAHVYRK